MTDTIRTTISGDFTRADLDRLTWAIAWSGTVSPQDRAEQESDLGELTDEMRDHFDDPFRSVKTVTVERGQVTGYTEYTADEMEG